MASIHEEKINHNLMISAYYVFLEDLAELYYVFNREQRDKLSVVLIADLADLEYIPDPKFRKLGRDYSEKG